ncbi:MAG: DUF4350 domain-containing protein [bacterium]
MRFLAKLKSASGRETPRVAAGTASRWGAPLGFLSLALLWCQVGYLLPGFSRPLGGILWLLTVYLTAEKRKGLWLLISAVLLFNPLIGAVHRPEGLWLLGLLPWAGGAWGRRWMGAAWLAALGGWVWANTPGLWVPLDDFSAQVSAWLSGANLSSVAAGLPLFGIAACLPLAQIITERRFYSPLIALIALLLALFVYWGLLPPLDAYLHRQGVHGVHDAVNLQWLLLLLLGAALFVWGWMDAPRSAEGSRASIWTVAAFALLGAFVVSLPPKIGSPATEKQIVFYNKGYLNWDIPRYGYYGQHSAGMFGLLPDYLIGKGFQVVKCDSLTQEVLASARVVVFINLQDQVSASEAQRIHQFVEQGGSLLLLGDHTGMANIRAPSNELLKPYGIELNFDSAKPTRSGWVGSMVSPQHPLTARLDLLRQGGDNPAKTQIWVGASLKVNSPAKPVLVGRDGWSDLGNEKNEKDGFLGDFRYQWGERLGNLSLVAEARSGKGKVLVFGDTSTLQNGALVRAGDFAVRLFDYLLAPTMQPPGFVRFLGALLLLAALLFWMLGGGTETMLLLGVIAFFIGAQINQQRFAFAGDFPLRQWTQETTPRALLDHSHAPRTPLNQTSLDSHWGLQNTLMRSQFLPQVMEKWDVEILNDARILIEIAPARKFSGAQRGAVADFMQQGGLVILCCGMEEFDGSRSLLKDYGLEPIYVPLGPSQLETEVVLSLEDDTTGVPQSRKLTVQFHEAWEVRVANPNAQVLLEGYDKPVVVFVPVGEGGLLYIPDTDFLSNCNLESVTDEYYLDNILYLKYLLQELVGDTSKSLPSSGESHAPSAPSEILTPAVDSP